MKPGTVGAGGTNKLEAVMFRIFFERTGKWCFVRCNQVNIRLEICLEFLERRLVLEGLVAEIRFQQQSFENRPASSFSRGDGHQFLPTQHLLDKSLERLA